MASLGRPRGLLFDYGGTLVEEVGFDHAAGMAYLRRRAAHWPAEVTVEDVMQRAARITRDVADQRDRLQLETPWPALTRLIYDYFGIRFDADLADLELEYWNAAVTTRPMPGAAAALKQCREWGLPLGIVSNTSFRAAIIEAELAKHGLARYFDVHVASADYAVRKPNPLLYDVAAARLGVPPRDVWFVGDRLDTDIAGARSAGMTAVLLHSSDSSPFREADIAVGSWDELLEQLERYVS